MSRLLYATTAFYIQLCCLFYVWPLSLGRLRKLCKNQGTLCAVPKSPLFADCMWTNPLIISSKANCVAVLKLIAKLGVPNKVKVTSKSQDINLPSLSMTHDCESVIMGWIYFMEEDNWIFGIILCILQEVVAEEISWSHFRILKTMHSGKAYVRIGNVSPLKETITYKIQSPVSRGHTKSSNTSRPNKGERES